MAKGEVLNKKVFDYITEEVMRKRIKPGDKIAEISLSNTLDVSRIPVRDALRELDNLGIVESFPKRFTQAKIYDEKMIREVGSLRLNLDIFSINLAIDYGSMVEFNQLSRIAEDCLSAYEAGDYYEQNRLDADFHCFLAKISKHSLLYKTQMDINMRVRYILTHYEKHLDKRSEKDNLSIHVQIVEAMIQHDREQALNLIKRHLTNFYPIKELALYI